IYPFVCRISTGIETQEETWVKRTFFRSIVVLSLLISMMLFLFAPLAIRMIGGATFEDAVLVLRIIAFLPLVIELSNIFGFHTMLPLHMDREVAQAVASAALIGMVGTFLLTHVFGLPGAALALLSVEVLLTLMTALLLRRRTSI